MLSVGRPRDPVRDGAKLGQDRTVVPHQCRNLALRVNALERFLPGVAASAVELVGFIGQAAFLKQDVRTERAGMRTPEKLQGHLLKKVLRRVVACTPEQRRTKGFAPAGTEPGS